MAFDTSKINFEITVIRYKFYPDVSQYVATVKATDAAGYGMTVHRTAATHDLAVFNAIRAAGAAYFFKDARRG